jgi:hypothetical protein
MGSASRLAIKTMPYSLDAAFHNHVQLSLMHLGEPLQLSMEKLQVTLQLEQQQWTAYFMPEPDMPLLRWQDFEPHSDGLNEPVACTLLLYHYQSWLMFPQVLAEMDRQLHRLLEDLPNRPEIAWKPRRLDTH